MNQSGRYTIDLSFDLLNNFWTHMYKILFHVSFLLIHFKTIETLMIEIFRWKQGSNFFQLKDNSSIGDFYLSFEKNLLKNVLRYTIPPKSWSHIKGTLSTSYFTKI